MVKWSTKPIGELCDLINGRAFKPSDWGTEGLPIVRIQNLNLGYTYHSKSVKCLSNVRLYVNASNLYTFTKFKGYDPEVGTDGLYWGGYPRLRKWTFGLDITF